MKNDEHMSTPQEYMYRYYAYIFDGSLGDEGKSYLINRLIASETGFEFTCDCWMGAPLREVVSSHKGYIYIIGVGSKSQNAFSPTFDEIISGFELP